MEIENKEPAAELEDKTTAAAAESEEEGAMSFWDHLEVLRWALFRSACVLAVIMVGTFIAMPYIFDRFILAPTSNDFFTYRLINRIGGGMVTLSPDFDVQIININVASQFMTHISTSISLAAVIAFPYFIWEIWKFIEPALFEDEVKHLRPAFLGGTLMFYVGCTIGYMLVFPFTFRFLVEYNLSSNITNQINLQSYIDNFTMLILVMGIVLAAQPDGNPAQELPARIQTSRGRRPAHLGSHHHPQRRPLHPHACLHPALRALRTLHPGRKRQKAERRNNRRISSSQGKNA